jgi:hypothetical protein
LVNEPPFNSTYKVGDYLAVNLDQTIFLSPNTAERGKIRNGSGVVAKVVEKDPSTPYYKNIPIYKSEEFAGE